MKCLIVVSVDLPHPDKLIDILNHMDLPKIPFFDGAVRVVVGPDVDDTIEFLEEYDTPTMQTKENQNG